MKLDEIRVEIDKIDRELQQLIMKRLDCSYKVAESKFEADNYTIYRADREEAILDKLSAGIPEERKAGYLAVVRKITETSRMYQYGLLYEWKPELFQPLLEGRCIPATTRGVKLILTRPNIPNAMSSILSMVGDYGYNMETMTLLSYSDDNEAVTFALTILGDLNTDNMKKLMFQLSKESTGFKITDII